MATIMARLESARDPEPQSENLFQRHFCQNLERNGNFFLWKLWSVLVIAPCKSGPGRKHYIVEFVAFVTGLRITGIDIRR